MNSLEQLPTVKKIGTEARAETRVVADKEVMAFHQKAEVLAKAQAVQDKQREEEILTELFGNSQGERMKESECLTETAEVIKKVDYKTLKSIFDEMRSRAGAQGESNFCGPERIVIDEGMGGAEFDLEKGIAIAPALLSKRASEEISRASFRNHILSALIHEETHASSKNVEKKLSSGRRFWERTKSLFKKPDPYKASGYDRRQFQQGTARVSFTDFNEGVTDKIAEEVYTEYLKRTGERGMVSDQDHPAQYNVEAYLGSRAMVTGFIEIVAKSAEVPSEVVWEAVKQGYMTGLDLQGTELQKMFEETFSKGFTGRLEEWGSGEQGGIHEELLEKAESLDLTEEAKEKVRLAFEEYSRSVEKRKFRF